MDIYIVQAGDTIQSIANKFTISVEKLIRDNGLINATTLVLGQAIIILYPQKTYVVKPGDTLSTIAETNGISIMQLIRNNPFLFYRNHLNTGESLVISYDTEGDIEINGYAYSFINRDILKHTSPYLTYISVFNYRITEDIQIINYGDDSDIIKIAKDYQTIPLLMISAFSPAGDVNPVTVYNLLLSEEKQDKLINNMVQLVKDKGFKGINLLISFINEINQNIYLKALTKMSKALKNEGFIFIISLNPDLSKTDNSITYNNLDYNSISSIVDKLIFLNDIWGINKEPPAPVTSISLISSFMDKITPIISPKFIVVGVPLIGYDWEIPFVSGSSYANSMSLNSTITLAYDQQATIYLDAESQTPYFNYIKSYIGYPETHIVWFIDARTINSLVDVILKYNLAGSGIWNLTSSNQQLWSILNSRFNIVKLTV